MLWRQKKIESVGPSPIPASLYASRHLPVGRALAWVARGAMVIGVVAIISGVGVVALYKIPGGDALLLPLSRVLPIPAARVNGHSIAYRDYARMLEGWTFLYERQGVLEAVGEETVERRVMDRLVQDALVAEMLRAMRVTVPVVEENETWEALAKPYGSEAVFAATVQEQFGWDAKAFRAYVVEPLVRLRAADAAVLQWSEAQREPKAVMDALYADVRIAPDRFEEMASQASASLLLGDDDEVGLRLINNYPVESRAMLAATPTGAVTDVVELADRFVLYKIIRREREESEVRVEVRELSIEKRDVHDILRAWTAEARIKIYVR